MRQAMAAGLALAVLLSGCAMPVHPREVDQLLPVETLGYDGVPGTVTVSVSAPGEEDSCRLTGRGPGLTEAIRDARARAPREELFLAHVRFALAGETAARAGLEGLLDWFERGTQTRLDLPLLIVKDARAEELVTGSEDPEYEITALLAALEQESRRAGAPYCFTVLDTARSLAERGTALCCAVTAEAADGGAPSAKDALVPRAAGYAVLKDSALAGFLDPEAAFGADLLLDQAGERAYTLPVGSGRVTAALRQSHAELTPGVEDGVPVLTVRLTGRAGILEAEGVDPLGAVEELDGALGRAMGRQCAAALSAARELKADFLSLAELWEDAFPPEELLSGLTWRITAEGIMDRSYDIDGSVPVRGEEDKNG